MKVTALKEKVGAYEIRQNDETLFGGIVINGKNQGVGFVGKPEGNQYIFEVEEGTFSKSFKVYFQSKVKQIGEGSLGFTESGTLKFSEKDFEWQTLGSSKIWLDSEKNVVILFDLENNAETAPNILVSTNLEAKVSDLLVLCGWLLIVVEWRSGFTNSVLAGLQVKPEEFIDDRKSQKSNRNWLDVLGDIIDVAT